MKVYVIDGEIERRLEGVEQARAATNSVEEALIIKGIGHEELQLLAFPHSHDLPQHPFISCAHNYNNTLQRVR